MTVTRSAFSHLTRFNTMRTPAISRARFLRSRNPQPPASAPSPNLNLDLGLGGRRGRSQVLGNEKLTFFPSPGSASVLRYDKFLVLSYYGIMNYLSRKGMQARGYPLPMHCITLLPPIPIPIPIFLFFSSSFRSVPVSLRLHLHIPPSLPDTRTTFSIVQHCTVGSAVQ